MRHFILLLLLCAGCATARPNPYKNMTLTQLATTICLQTGMNDTDDQAAAMTFLQTRLMMIWNSQLWKDSLIEANFTINPDGTSTLGNTIWIPGRSTLMLPPEFDNVLAVRTDGHTLRVASLESYYRQDMDWLNQNGDPTQFNVLRPAVWEFATATPIFGLCQNAQDIGLMMRVTLSQDGVQLTHSCVNPFVIPAVPAAIPYTATPVFNPPPIGNALVVFNVSQPASAASLGLGLPAILGWIQVSGTGTAADRYYAVNGLQNGKPNYTGVPFMISSGAGQPLEPDNGASFGIFWDGGQWVFVGGPFGDDSFGNIYVNHDPVATPDLCNLGDWSNFSWWQNPNPVIVPTQVYLPEQFALSGPSAGSMPLRQRIRLVTNPQVSVNLRVLGKGACPVLGPYDLMPINNVEPALMAFARGDMLLRQRQNGKAQIAAQEGASLLAALARSEVFQQAANNRIIPDAGFGDGSMHFGGDSFHPL